MNYIWCYNGPQKVPGSTADPVTGQFPRVLQSLTFDFTPKDSAPYYFYANYATNGLAGVFNVRLDSLVNPFGLVSFPSTGSYDTYFLGGGAQASVALTKDNTYKFTIEIELGSFNIEFLKLTTEPLTYPTPTAPAPTTTTTKSVRGTTVKASQPKTEQANVPSSSGGGFNVIAVVCIVIALVAVSSCYVYCKCCMNRKK
jgi:hypothetical protein